MTPSIGSSIVSRLRYRDALAATDGPCHAFGAGKHAVYADGVTVHPVVPRE